MQETPPTPWTRLGPHDDARFDRLEVVVRDFYRRVLADPMIGFLFRPEDRDRLVAHETAFTAALLGGPNRYTGRGMGRAHAASPILSGHFDRRQVLLKRALSSHGIPPVVEDAWLAHNERLRPKVVRARCAPG